MHSVVFAAEVMTDVMDLGMAVMAAGDAVIGAGAYDLVKLGFAVGAARFCETGLQETAAAAAAVVVRFVRRHLDDVFRADYRLNDEAQVIGNRIAKTLADNLAWVLDRELDLAIFVPIRVDLQLALANPLGVVRIDGSNFKFVLDTEFVQSRPDCKGDVPSLGIEKDLTPKVVGLLGGNPRRMFPTLIIGQE